MVEPLVYTLEDLQEMLSLDERAIYKAIDESGFPPPRQLSPQKIGWIRSEVEDWLSARPVKQPNTRILRERTELYRHFDGAGRLLYVGVSLSTVARLSSHMQGSGWASEIARLTIERFATRAEALAAELKAIREERPLYNIAGVLPGDEP